MVKKAREDQKISLQRMAKAVHSSASALSRYERGERPWPSALYARVLHFLGLAPEVDEEFWCWKQHRAYWDSYTVETDPGTTWADLKEGYPEFYQRLKPYRTPCLAFRRRVRADSLLEGCLYHSFCEAGAACAYISLLAMSFPHHPIVNENFKPISMSRRAAFVLDGWIFWPQVNLLVNGLKIRLDFLGCNGKEWVGVEGDGDHHTNVRQQAWDRRRDASLGFRILRFTKDEILAGKFIELLRIGLGKEGAQAA